MPGKEYAQLFVLTAGRRLCLVAYGPALKLFGVVPGGKKKSREIFGKENLDSSIYIVLIANYVNRKKIKKSC